MKTYYLYILSARDTDECFIDITDDLAKSVKENKGKLNERCGKNKYILAYYEKAGTVVSAISNRKKILKWDKVWKRILIEHCNPEWKDLTPGTEDMKIKEKINRRAAH